MVHESGTLQNEMGSSSDTFCAPNHPVGPNNLSKALVGFLSVSVAPISVFLATGFPLQFVGLLIPGTGAAWEYGSNHSSHL